MLNSRSVRACGFESRVRRENGAVSLTGKAVAWKAMSSQVTGMLVRVQPASDEKVVFEDDFFGCGSWMNVLR